MSFTEVLEKIITPLFAAAIGAILAFRYQHTLELKRDKRAVIQNLMMYRNVGALELDWIKSLNAIDLVFSKDKKVKDLYHTFVAETSPSHFKNSQWIETFYKMVYEMGQCSGYKNLTLQDIRDFYSPEALAVHYPNMNIGSKPEAPTSEVNSLIS